MGIRIYMQQIYLYLCFNLRNQNLKKNKSHVNSIKIVKTLSLLVEFEQTVHSWINGAHSIPLWTAHMLVVQ